MPLPSRPSEKGGILSRKVHVEPWLNPHVPAGDTVQALMMKHNPLRAAQRIGTALQLNNDVNDDAEVVIEGTSNIEQAE